MISRQKKLRQRVNGWRGVESYFLFLDSAASIISLGSAAYSGLQEFGRFSARLPHGQQSSAAFLELGGNAMICRDTPQILETTRSTHVGCIVHNAAPIFLGRMVQIRGKVVSEYWMARPPAWSLPLSREGGTSQNSHLQSATLPLCHFKESRPGCDVPPPRICEEM